jgi:alpha-L-fucosidase 2
LQSEWMRYHIQGGLEILAEMLDYYDYTGDASFAKNSLVPLADTVITFYDQHWKRGADGKILLSPAQSIETYQVTAVNPTPDIAGLLSTLPRLLSLPKGLSEETDQTLWSRVLKDVPPLPLGRTAKGKLPPLGKGDPDGTPVILPAQAYDKTRNAENPELYTVFPYHLYGIGKPDLDLARATYKARLFHMSHCWGQDALDAAMIGLTDDARKAVVEELTFYGSQQFRWFWRKADWIPDMDDGGAGMMALQLMLMQCDGRRILLLPTWPRDWTADFKLHAPYQTTVEGHVENGKISKLRVSPRARAKDVVVVQPTD